MSKHENEIAAAVRSGELGVDLFGKAANRWRVIRTSNSYAFIDPKPAARPESSKSELKTGTTVQDSILPMTRPVNTPLDPTDPLHIALMRLGRSVGAIK